MTFHTPLDLRTAASQALAHGHVPTRRDEKNYILLNPLRYEVGELGSGDVIIVRTGFVTDLASVPRVVRSVVGPSGLHASAAVVHDYLYREQRDRSRREADAIFLEAMLISCTPKIRAYVMWAVVRLAGWLPYWQNGR